MIAREFIGRAALVAALAVGAALVPSSLSATLMPTPTPWVTPTPTPTADQTPGVVPTPSPVMSPSPVVHAFRGVQTLEPASGASVAGRVLARTHLDPRLQRAFAYLEAMEMAPIIMGGMNPNGSVTGTVEIDTTLVADGIYNLTMGGVDPDGVGQWASTTILISNSPEPPYVKIITPVDGERLEDDLVRIRVRANKVGAVTLTIDGCADKGGWCPEGAEVMLAETFGSGIYTYQWRAKNWPDGAHRIRATAVTLANQMVSDEINVTSFPPDIRPPQITRVTPDGTRPTPDVVRLRIEATDNRGIDRMEIRYRGTLIAELDEAPWEFDWDTRVFANGEGFLDIRAFDAAGNMGSKTAYFFVWNDVVAPKPFFAAPKDGERVAGVTKIRASMVDASPALMTFLIDGQVVLIDRSFPWEYAWDTTRAAEGEHTLSVIAQDQGGLTGTTEIKVTVVRDLTPPRVQITAPAPNALVSGWTDITADASDNERLTELEITVDDRLVGLFRGAPPYRTAANLSANGAGVHRIRARATDIAGLVTEHAIDVRVSDKPTIRFLSPAAGETVPLGNVSVFTLAADDRGFSRAEFFVNGVLETVDVTPSFGYLMSTVGRPAGPLTLKVVVYDNDLNRAEDEITVTVGGIVDSVPPIVAIQSPAHNATVGGVTPVVAVAADYQSGLQEVIFLVDGVIRMRTTDRPVFLWNTLRDTEGAHTITIRAVDRAGLTADVSRPFIVKHETTATDAISVGLVSPAPGALITGPTEVVARVFSGGPVDNVDIFVNDVLKYSKAGQPSNLYGFTGRLPDGLVRLRVVANGPGGTGTHQIAVNVSNMSIRPRLVAASIAVASASDPDETMTPLTDGQLATYTDRPMPLKTSSAHTHLDGGRIVITTLQLNGVLTTAPLGAASASDLADLPANGRLLFSIDLTGLERISIAVPIRNLPSIGSLGTSHDFRVFRHNGAGWEPETGLSFDPTTGFMAGDLAGGGALAVMDAGVATAGVPHALGQTFAFPNPARGTFPTLHLELGQPDSVALAFFNQLGELVHQAKIDGSAPLVGGVPAFRYQWDTSGVASGIYYVAVVAKKAGQPDLIKRLKVAVIK